MKDSLKRYRYQVLVLRRKRKNTPMNNLIKIIEFMHNLLLIEPK